MILWFCTPCAAACKPGLGLLWDGAVSISAGHRLAAWGLLEWETFPRKPLLAATPPYTSFRASYSFSLLLMKASQSLPASYHPQAVSPPGPILANWAGLNLPSVLPAPIKSLTTNHPKSMKDICPSPVSPPFWCSLTPRDGGGQGRPQSYFIPQSFSPLCLR